MSTNRNHYELWFKRLIQNLYADGDAGFVILMISIPLLERYLREKSGIHESRTLNDNFYQELVAVFPSLLTSSQAEKFWQVYRNGLLHQVTLSKAPRKGMQVPGGWLNGNAPALHIDSNGEFWVDPKKFAETILNKIDSDFSTFEGASSVNHPMPSVFSSGVGLSDGTGNAAGYNPPAKWD